MWASGPWLPGWLSPECLVWYWIGGLLLAFVCQQTERPELAALLTRLVLKLALLQSVVIGLAWGYVQRTPLSVHVNEVYVVAAAVSSILLVATAGWLLVATIRTPDLWRSYPSVQGPQSRLAAILWWVAWPGVLVGSYICNAMIVGGFVRFMRGEYSLQFVTFTFVITALACAASLWRGAFTDTVRGFGALAGIGAFLAQVSLSVFYLPVHGMTDAGLVKAFDDRVEIDELASDVMTELGSRKNMHFSSLAAAVHALRATPNRLGRRVDAAFFASQGYPGCTGFNLTPTPYHGRPELDLLALLINRGELDEPRAWSNDPSVPDDLRTDVRALLRKTR